MTTLNIKEPCSCPEGPCEHYPYQARGHVLLWRQGKSGHERWKEVWYLTQRAKQLDAMKDWKPPPRADGGRDIPPPAIMDAPKPTEIESPVGYGPGTELHSILESFGASPNDSCLCRAMAEQMDRWAVAGCKERRAEIIEWLRRAKDHLNWTGKLKIAARALAAGMVSPTDPIGFLVDEAIRRAEEKGSNQ